MMRRAFTLVEVMVVIGLLSIMIGAFVLSRASGEHQVVDLDFHATALRSSQLLFAVVKADFDNYAPPATPVTPAAPSQPEVAFSRYRSGALTLDAQHHAETEPVTFRFDRTQHKVFRGNAPIEAGPFESVKFTLAPGAAGDVLRVEVEIVPPEFLGRGGAGAQRAQFLVDMTGLQSVVNQAYDRWTGGE